MRLFIPLERAVQMIRPWVAACLLGVIGAEAQAADPVAPPARPTAPAKRVAPKKAPPPQAATAARPKTAISFTGQIAPLLTRHCGGCHVAGSKGGFHVTSYETLMKTGVVQRGDGEASRLVEVIATGDMPRGGGKVSPQELASLVAWINAGAAFDGPDPAAPLDRAVGGGAATPAMAASTAAVALEPGQVSFAFDIAPVLVQNCVGCHGDTRPSGRFTMTTFARLVRGGQSGAPFVAGRSGDSLLIRKIKGSAGIDGQRMPIGKPPLPADTIALVAKWIDEGARLDMLSADTPLADLAAAGRARGLSHADLAAIRTAAAESLWRRAIPDETPQVVQAGDVVVIGNLPPTRHREAAAAIEKATAEARELLGVGDGPLLKGGVACYLFAKPYDYSGFREAIVGEERPKGMTGDAGRAGDVVYAAAIAPSSAGDDSADDLTAVATEQIVTAALQGRGAPAWFARGAGRAVAARIVPKAAIVKGWRQEATDAVGRLGSPDDFFGGYAGPVAQAAIAGGFVAAVAPAPAKLRPLVERLDAGMPFETAFAEVSKGQPQPLFTAWAAKQSRKPAGKR